MLYKYLEDGTWLKAENEVATPDGIINRDKLSEGWEWYDEVPSGYDEWYKSQNPKESSLVDQSGYYKKYNKDWCYKPASEDTRCELINDGYTFYKIPPDEYLEWLKK